MNISIFSSPINIFKSLLKPRHNIESVLSSSFFLLRKSAIFSPFDLAYRFQYMLQNKEDTLKMENLMSRCINETTQTTTDTTLTTIFGILAKTLMHTIYNLQHEQPVYSFKAKTLISLSANETTQTTIFSIGDKKVLALKATHTTIFS